jgi:hypothetical protein
MNNIVESILPTILLIGTVGGSHPPTDARARAGDVMATGSHLTDTKV